MLNAWQSVVIVEYHQTLSSRRNGAEKNPDGIARCAERIKFAEIYVT